MGERRAHADEMARGVAVGAKRSGSGAAASVRIPERAR